MTFTAELKARADQKRQFAAFMEEHRAQSEVVEMAKAGLPNDDKSRFTDAITMMISQMFGRVHAREIVCWGDRRKAALAMQEYEAGARAFMKQNPHKLLPRVPLCEVVVRRKTFVERLRGCFA